MALAVDQFPKNSVTEYDKLRKTLQNGDILICSGTGFFSLMIQKATNSIWSHVAFVLRLDSIDRLMLLESVEPIGVRTVRLSKYLNDYGNDGKPYPGGMAIIRNKEFKNAVNPKKLATLARYAVDQFGYPYDNDEIAKIAVRILGAKVEFTKTQKKKIKRDREFICSEYVALCYETIGLKVKWNSLGFVAPSDFAADPSFDLVAVLKKR